MQLLLAKPYTVRHCNLIDATECLGFLGALGVFFEIVDRGEGELALQGT